MGSVFDNFFASHTTVIDIPTLITSTIINVTSTGATSGGNVLLDGNATITTRGICWNTSANPTTANSKLPTTGTVGTFVSNFTGLTASTFYYVRAYATNSAGTAYGSQQTFTTASSGSIPIVTSSSISTITDNSATSGGYVVSDGGYSVTARGICWNTSQNPTITNIHTSDGTGTGGFSSSLTGLTSDTYYWVRAYATNSKGTAYGDNVGFRTHIPPGLPIYWPDYAITIDGVRTVFKGSLDAASEADYNWRNPAGRIMTLEGYKTVASSLTLGNVVYIESTNYEAIRITDGYYLILDYGSPVYDIIIHTVSGVIDAIRYL